MSIKFCNFMVFAEREFAGRDVGRNHGPHRRGARRFAVLFVGDHRQQLPVYGREYLPEGHLRLAALDAAHLAHHLLPFHADFRAYLRLARLGRRRCGGGLSALLSMLNSCASGVSVVNIDNGFGAGYLAGMINHMAKRREEQ